MLPPSPKNAVFSQKNQSPNAISASSQENLSESNAIKIPEISLPKGGGAIRGMGEKFAANPVTGTGTMSVPIATSPGRSGFGPQLSLSYNSGSGNGPFGFGWQLSTPAITRKTDKGLPRYLDAEESDVFLLSGAEDLVPVFRKEDNGDWAFDVEGKHIIDDKARDGYMVRPYRPRIEGLFARIECWTRLADGDIHWRSISKDNILTVYGKDANSRIAKPGAPQRIFSWLICETRDDKGNAIVYEYKPEDGIGAGLSQAHERNRGDRNDARRTANRYLKSIRYGNHLPLLDQHGKRPRILTPGQVADTHWMFEVVFDYGEHDDANPTPRDPGEWNHRFDAFSSYRAGFEVRTCRQCQRILMFHHFPNEPEVGANCLVRSTDFTYSNEQNPADARNPAYSFLVSVTQSGYKRQAESYLAKSLPPLEFQYTQPVVQDAVHEVDPESLENLPVGLDGADYRWADLHGEGIPGILTEQGEGWFYKRNVSPISERPVEFAPLERVALQPNLRLRDGQAQFMDLAGDGQPDLAVLDGPMPGFYEHDDAEGWQDFRPFAARLHRDTGDPNLRFIDLNGDGHADVLISENDAFVWHPSLGEDGYGPAQRVAKVLDEEKGPRLAFADATQSIFLADLSGDGLADLVRIRNGEVCYWPNLGYGRFGAKVAMDEAPVFDHPDQFDLKRLRLADIDGTGTTDLIYLHRDGIRLYFNQSGNSWSAPHLLTACPKIDDIASITPVDLRGNGTACLAWSSPLPGDAGRQMRYIDLMGGQKPHLLVRTVNNLGAETRVSYASSTKFYLKDKYEGKPWLTKLPFLVHVVERVETYDRISRNRFASRYAYHHGYFDGEEREFRGFGMVEQWDTEAFEALGAGDNIDEASHVPPVLTKTWFHTGAYFGRQQVSRQHAGQYYGAPVLDDPDYEGKLSAFITAKLLEDTLLPGGLTPEEEREACRALKGAMLRQEVYALDSTAKDAHPYTVAEQSFAIRLVQPQGGNRHAAFFTHAHESLTYHYERNPAHPRVQHALTLEVDDYGNVRKAAAIGYGRQPNLELPLEADRDKQARHQYTYMENRFTNAIDDTGDYPDDYRPPLSAETSTYELAGYTPGGISGRFQHSDFVQPDEESPRRMIHLFDREIQYEEQVTVGRERRLIERVCMRYRKNDLSSLLPPGQMDSLALPGESYQLAFTPGLLAQVFQRDEQPLLPDPVGVLGSQAADGGGSTDLENDGHWWIPSGRIFFSPDAGDTAAEELTYAQQHFFLPQRFRNPFHTDTVPTESRIAYDAYDLLMRETQDAVDNRMTVEINDYRVLQPRQVSDANRNRTAVAFDALGMVVGTAVMGKPAPAPAEGDSLGGFVPDLPETVIRAHLANPLGNPHAILGTATSRLVYDLFAYHRTKEQPDPQPAVVYTLVRETHEADLQAGEQAQIQHSFGYSDGFGREIQKKIQAEAGRSLETSTSPPRWVGSGSAIFNNKSMPVRQYEPFFSATHQFEFGREVGVSPILFYDPLGRAIATLHPNHTYEKVTFGPWRQQTYDVNDTVAPRGAETGDPRTDPDIRGYVAAYFATQPDTWLTWYGQRQAGALGPEEQEAAVKAAAHADTPTTAYFDTLGRPFLTLAHNRVVCASHELDGTENLFTTRVELDIEGNQRSVSDAQGRIVMQYAYDMLGRRIYQLSMEAGARWMLIDASGNPIRAWDNRGHAFRTEYDPMRRPLRSFVTGTNPDMPNHEVLTERLVYGEQHPEAEQRNLRGTLYLHLDQAGTVTNDALDFKGNPLRASRRFTNGTQYREALDWRAEDAAHQAFPTDAKALFDPARLEAVLAPRLEVGTYTSRTTYDALNRPVTLTTPHTAAMPPNIIRPGYNEANLLERLDANLRGETAEGQPVWTPFVANIDYDAKGQRQRIEYGNGVSTQYTYDPLTFRLTRLYTTRQESSPLGGTVGGLQNIHYTYDPAGNITRIRDDAQQRVYFRNKRVDPNNDYTYDAIYRLIQATGREHLGQANGKHNPPTSPSAFNTFHTRLPHPGDGNALGRYAERYVYDAVGNFLQMQHRGTDPAHPGWTRHYAYEERSGIEDGADGNNAKFSNRLSQTRLGNGNRTPDRYVYDAHGNMIRMPHLGGTHPAPNMHWDYQDQLRRVDLNGGGTAYYFYDASGQRVRKLTEQSGGTLKEERIYLGGFEVYRRHTGSQAGLERETLHIMDDQQRIALVETRTQGHDPAPAQLTRYQFGNHLGSACLELDGQAQVISYEEYTPYGSTSYQAVRNQQERPKRYRYTGKERDEESGLYYYGARYYAGWLGRWCSADSASLSNGLRLFVYVRNNPIRFHDPTGYAEEEGPWSRFATGVGRGLGNLMLGGVEQGIGMLQTLAENPHFLAMGLGVGMMGSIQAKMMEKQLLSSAEKHGGGITGFAYAANETFNPAVRMLISGFQVADAAEKGEIENAGEAFVEFVVSTVETVTFAVGAVKGRSSQGKLEAEYKRISSESSPRSTRGVIDQAVESSTPMKKRSYSERGESSWTPEVDKTGRGETSWTSETAPIHGKAQVTSPGHDTKVAARAREMATWTDAKAVHQNASIKRLSEGKVSRARQPDITLETDQFLLHEQVSPTDNLVAKKGSKAQDSAIVNRTLKTLLELGELGEGVFIEGSTMKQMRRFIRILNGFTEKQ